MKISLLSIAVGALAVLSVALYELALAFGLRHAVEASVVLAGVGLVIFGLTRDAD